MRFGQRLGSATRGGSSRLTPARETMANLHTRWLTLVVLTLSAIGSFDARAIAAAPTIKITAVTVQAAKDTTPTPRELKRCFGTGAERDRCLDGLFREFLAGHSTVEALKLVDRYGATDTDIRLACHPIVHAVGRETFRIKKTIHDSFTACDQTCHSGCYHGAVERFLRGDTVNGAIPGHISQEDLRRRASDACDPRASSRMRFQCLHGLGHAVMYFTGYRLGGALEICDGGVDTWSRQACYGGVFMENLFSVTPEQRDISPTDYHYPCNRLDARYRADCYMIQTWRMSEMGLSTEELFAECARAGAYRSNCVTSIGRDLSNDVRTKDPRKVARACERRTAQDRRACVRGVVYALIDNTWDGRYALPFCSLLTAVEDSASCFRASAGYLIDTFEAARDRLERNCGTQSTRARACIGAVRYARGRR